MKKILAIMIALLFIVGCDSGKLRTIKFSEFQTKINNKDSFALVLASTTCAHCEDYKVTLNSIIDKYGIEVYLLYIDKLSEDERNQLKSLFIFNSNMSTPTTIFVEEGIEKNTYDRIVGAINYTKVVNKFKSKGYIR